MAVETTPLVRTDISETKWPELTALSPDLLRGLPKTVIEQGHFVKFFRDQGARLEFLQYKETVKMESAEIHDWDEIRSQIESFSSPITVQESAALDHLYQHLSQDDLKVVGIQTGEGAAGHEVSDTLHRAQEYVNQYLAAHPEAKLEGGSMPDVWDQLFGVEVREEKKKRDDELMRLLSVARDPETAMLIIAQWYTDFYGQKLAKAMEIYKTEAESQSVRVQGLAPNATTTQMLQANATLSQTQGFLGMTTQVIQSLRTNIDQIQNVAHSVIGTINELELGMIRHVSIG